MVNHIFDNNSEGLRQTFWKLISLPCLPGEPFPHLKSYHTSNQFAEMIIMQCWILTHKDPKPSTNLKCLIPIITQYETFNKSHFMSCFHFWKTSFTRNTLKTGLGLALVLQNKNENDYMPIKVTKKLNLRVKKCQSKLQHLLKY